MLIDPRKWLMFPDSPLVFDHFFITLLRSGLPAQSSRSQIQHCASSLLGRSQRVSVLNTVLGKLGLSKSGVGKLGPSPIWWQIRPHTFWGPVCHFLTNWAQAFGPWKMLVWQNGPRQIVPLYHEYICIGYTAKNWRTSVQSNFHWYWTYFANNWENICLLEVSVCPYGPGWRYVRCLEYVLTYVCLYYVSVGKAYSRMCNALCIFSEKKNTFHNTNIFQLRHIYPPIVGRTYSITTK